MSERGDALLRARLEKLQRLRQAGLDPYPPRSHRTHTVQQALALYQEAEARQGPDARTEEVWVAGRVTALRGMGRATFLDLRDGTGRLQAHFRQDLLGEERYALLRHLDLGDFLEVRGPLFRTRAGEVTVETRHFTVLCKALRPPPEKWHGLRDVEQRYRQRELDLMANPDVRNRFVLRSRVVNAIRRFLTERGFIEVETPILLPVAAGALARPFVTYHNALDRTLYLRIATELHLKRCLVGGLERVFEIGRVFRNEGLDIKHNPEFTTLESYQAYADYQDVMRMVEEMVCSVAQEVLGSPRVPWGDGVIDFTPPWRRVSLREEVHRRTGIDLEEVWGDAPALAERMRALGIEVARRASWGHLVDKLLGEAVEPHLIQPTFLLDYPREMSPLAKEKREDPRYVERFEGFAGGMEIANAFTELNDPLEQRRRLEEQEALRRQYGEEEVERRDEEFLLALEHGMPPAGGLGMGIDRLVMLFTGQTSIREVVLFPHLSPSQEEVFRAVDRHIEEAASLGGDALSPQALVERVRTSLPRDLRERITEPELLRRVEDYLARRREG